MEEYLALIPAAGMGSRAQQNMAKQFQKIGAKCLIEYSIEPFLRDEKCQKICVVLQEEDEIWDSLSISSSEKIITCDGGTSRMESVHLGLKCLLETEDKNELIAIHDAARPCLIEAELNQLLSKAEEEIKNEGDGAFLAYQPVESVNIVTNGTVKESLERNKIWLSSTPQVFRMIDVYNSIVSAIGEEKIFSDEVSSVSNYLKGQIHAVPCSKSNFKVTRKEDFEVATKILKEIGRL
ncbi:MAG: 2-C-methyl-D-erythritol 4-phosphate cytidylyltransferase [Gammaproteobacteria bacterium]